jgi:hypothetical protein
MGPGIPAGVSGRCLLPPAPAFRPANEDSLRWSLLGLRNATLNDLAAEGAIADLLRDLDWRNGPDTTDLVDKVGPARLRWHHGLSGRSCHRTLVVELDWIWPAEPPPPQILGRLDVLCLLLEALFQAQAPLGTSVELRPRIRSQFVPDRSP